MDGYEKALNRIEIYWLHIEVALARSLPALSGDKEVILKELSSMTSQLKRIQEARKMLYQEMEKAGGKRDNATNDRNLEEARMDAARAARILEQLEDDEE
ncbi:MAG: hypothetical protein ACOC29_00980 [Candidatus Sumerlaeota bacterium]